MRHATLKADRTVRIGSAKVDHPVKLRLSSVLAASPEVGPLRSVMPYSLLHSAMRRTGRPTHHRLPRRGQPTGAARNSHPFCFRSVGMSVHQSGHDSGRAINSTLHNEGK
jgi:hypothetical protein